MLLAGLKSCGRFVQKQQGRAVQDCLGDADLAFQADGQGIQGGIEHPTQFQSCDHLFDPRTFFRAMEPAQGGDKVQEFPDRHSGMAKRLIKLVAHTLSGFERLCAGVEPLDCYMAAGGGHRTRYQV